jgi:hypothetical protein
MKRASVLVLILTVLAGCQPGRFAQCDPGNTSGANCNQQQGGYLFPALVDARKTGVAAPNVNR